MELLVVSKIEKKQSEKMGVSFFVVTMKKFDELASGRLIKGAIAKTRTIWPERSLTQPSGEVITFKEDAMFPEVRDMDNKIIPKFDDVLFPGKLVTVRTTEHLIGNNSVNQWSGIVFEGENPFTVALRAVNSGRAVKDVGVYDDDDVLLTLKGRAVQDPALGGGNDKPENKSEDEFKEEGSKPPVVGENADEAKIKAEEAAKLEAENAAKTQKPAKVGG